MILLIHLKDKLLTGFYKKNPQMGVSYGMIAGEAIYQENLQYI
jgi:hypothetical protein